MIKIRPYTRTEGVGPFKWTATGFIVENPPPAMIQEAEAAERAIREAFDENLYDRPKP